MVLRCEWLEGVNGWGRASWDLRTIARGEILPGNETAPPRATLPPACVAITFVRGIGYTASIASTQPYPST